MSGGRLVPPPPKAIFERALRGAALLGERWLSHAANRVWPLVEGYNRRFAGESFTPAWAPSPLIRKKDRSFPKLGWPRQTDSLCPDCVREVRAAVVKGERDVQSLIDGKPGEIKADIVERDGQIFMVKECATHGAFEDIMSTDPAFLARIEGLFPGHDYAVDGQAMRNHGSSSIKYGRGSVLTVDLTNRCNMMCEPCFMDANQVGYVHELAWKDIAQILGASMDVQPRRQMSVQFSGGEPTLHSDFIRSIAYAREIGYFCVQCASNGVRFAQDLQYCKAAKEAGLRLVYLQFDGVTNEANSHRKVANLFDVKQRAIENLASAGIDVILVVTLVNGLNDDQVGPIVDFAIENADKITVVSFQPVSFTGRDEEISEEQRRQQRYTLSQLAHDMHDQLGATEPLRDWYPLSSMNPFSDVMDLLQGPQAEFGALKCGCHPNCGIGTVLLVHKQTKRMVPLAELIDVDQMLTDFQNVADSGLGKKRTLVQLGLSVIRNFRPEKAPDGYSLLEFIRQILSQMGASGDKVGDSEGDAADFEWRFLFVAGMWFQDLFNYDFRRTEMCIIPYGTQEGEIPFCAYNTGIGWRAIVEKMHQTASVADWFEANGRHPIYAKNQNLELPRTAPDTMPEDRSEDDPKKASKATPAADAQDGRLRLRLVP